MKKNLFYSGLALVIASTLAFSCAKEADIQKPETKPESQEESGIELIEHEVQIIAGHGAETKTVLADDGADGFITKWSATDKIAVFQKLDEEWQTKKSSKGTSLSDGDKTASFTVDLSEGVGVAAYKYICAYPAAAATRSGEFIELTIPSEQTFTASCFDKNADILISEQIDRTTFSDEALSVGFARVGATAKMALKGLTAGETVESVTFSTTEDVALAGVVKYDVANVKMADGITSASQSLTLNAEDGIVVPESGQVVVWFRCNGAALSDNFTVVVNTRTSTNQNIRYTKAVDLATASRTLTFKAGHLATFAVAGLGSGRETVSYERLLDDGYYVIGYGAKVLSANDGTSSSYRTVINNPFIVENGLIDASSTQHAVWKVTWDSANNKYAFYSPSSGKYLYNSGNNSTTAAMDASVKYLYVYESDGAYGIYNNAAASDRHVGINSSNVGFYTGALTGTYKGAWSFTPAYCQPVVSYADIDLANSNAISTPVAVAASTFKFTNSIAFDGVYSNPAMTSEATWLTVNVSNATTGALSYTAEANTSATARTAYVKLTANGDHNTTSTVTLVVSQPKSGGSASTSSWDQVTDASSLASGDLLLFVNKSSKKVMGAQSSNIRSAISIDYDSDLGTSISEDDLPSGYKTIELGGSKDAWSLLTDEGYLYASSNNTKSSNYVGTRTNNNDSNGLWTISITSGNASIVAKGTNVIKYLQYNSSNPRFTCYASASQTPIQIYRLSGLKSAGLAYATSHVTKHIGDEAFTNTLTNPNNLTVSYSSTNTSVATVSASNGAVTIVGEGTATIVASSDATETHKAGFAHYDLTVSKQSAGLAYATTEVQKYVDDDSFTNELTNTHTLSVSYASDNTSVATVNASTGAVTIVGPGVAVISASYAGSDAYNKDEVSYTLTVIKHDAELSYGTAVVEKYVDADNFTNELTNEHGLTISYKSSKTDVATVNASTGEVDVLAVGETTITATGAENDVYYGGSTSYTLTVVRKDAELAYVVTAIEKYVDDDSFTHTLTNEHGLTIEYSSNNTSVATIDSSTGEVTLKGVTGEATITAHTNQTAVYLEDEATYTITVIKHPAGLAYETSEYNAKAWNDISTPVLTNPNNLSVKYSTTDDDVADVNEDTGELTIGQYGTATITATTEGDATHYGGTASYTVNVARRTISTMSFAEASVTVAKADEYGYFPELTITDEFGEDVPANLVSYSSSDSSIAEEDSELIHVFAPGTATLTASIPNGDMYSAKSTTLTVNVTGQLDAPTSVSMSSLSKTAIAASWTAPAGTVSGYTWKLYNASTNALVTYGDVTTNSVSTTINISAGTYYLKVLAKGNGGTITDSEESAASNNKIVSDTKQYTYTLTTSSFSDNGYGKTINAVTATANDSSSLSVSHTSSNAGRQQNGTNYYIQFKASSGCIYNTTNLGTVLSVTLNGASGNDYTVYKGNSQNPSSSGSGGYFSIKNGSSTLTCTSITVTFEK